MTLTPQTRAKLFFCHTQLFNSTAMSGWTFRICNNFTTLSGDQALLTWSTQLSRRHLRQYLWGMKCASWFWDMAIPNYYLHVHSVFFRLCWEAFMLHLLTSTMAGFLTQFFFKIYFNCHIHNNTAYNQQWNVFSAFNPSKCAHTPGAVGSQRCGAPRAVGGSVPCSRVSPQSWTIPAGAKIRTHNLRLQVQRSIH